MILSSNHAALLSILAHLIPSVKFPAQNLDEWQSLVGRIIIGRYRGLPKGKLEIDLNGRNLPDLKWLGLVWRI